MNHTYNSFVIRGCGDEATLKEHVAHAQQAINGYRAVQLGGIDRLTKQPLTSKQIQDLEDRIIRAETHMGEMKKALELYRKEREAPYQGPTRSPSIETRDGRRDGSAEKAYDAAMKAEASTATIAAQREDRTKCFVCAGHIPPGAGYHTKNYSFDTEACMKGFCE